MEQSDPMDPFSTVAYGYVLTREQNQATDIGAIRRPSSDFSICYSLRRQFFLV